MPRHVVYFTLFDTAIGRCAIAWHDDLIASVQLPDANDEALRQRMLRQCPAASESPPPAGIQHAIDRIAASLHGKPDGLADLPLDMSGVAPFHQRVYDVARQIAPGHTLTYGEIARQLGEPGAARAVGQALGHNPFAPVVPCHRVLAASSRPGGFSAPGGVTVKLKMLEAESARFGGQAGLFDA
jgi:methylated-DNA-[protein]-cysteine S-methyltransferase